MPSSTVTKSPHFELIDVTRRGELEGDGDADSLGEGEEDGDADSLGEGDGDADSLGEGDGDAVPED